MFIDKELYQNAYLQYQQWNTIRQTKRNHDATQSASTPAWQRYIDQVEVCWYLDPQRSPKQRAQKLAALDRHYTNVLQFERWQQDNARQN